MKKKPGRKKIAASGDLPVGSIERIVTRAMASVNAPGAAIAVVRDGDVFVKGFGEKALGSGDEVTKDTLFALASVSKAFTATACASLVGEKKMVWDDPARKFLPAFRLLDPSADTNVTVRDLLCHRTGLPRHDALWYRTDSGRADLLRKMAHLKPSATFRGLYQYSNLGYLAAGETAASCAGQPFEALLREKILAPLGMDRVSFSSANLLADPDHATGHRRVKGKVTPIEPLDFTNVGPAGAMNASAAEMVAWLKFQLSGGKGPDGAQLVDEKALAETHAPQMVVPFDDDTRALYPNRVNQTYGLGWSRYDWNGNLVLSHGGAIDGFRSHCALLPGQKIGFVILTNMVGYLPEMVRNSLLDLFTEMPEPSDWIEIFATKAKADEAKTKEAKEKRAKERQKDAPPNGPLDALAGTYSNPGYGDVVISLEKKKLSVRWATHAAPLKHYHRDTFDADTEALGFTGAAITFERAPDGAPIALTLLDQRFEKRPN